MRPALWLAVVACLAIGGLLLLPLVVLDADWTTVRLYLGGGLGGLFVVTALAGIVAIVALAAATDRSDPVTAASITLGVGLIMAIASAIWAISADPYLVIQHSSERWFTHHRWIVVATTVVVPLAALWAAVRGDIL